MNEYVDDFIENATLWKEETKLLRSLLLDAQLTEEYKWKQPCYTWHGASLVMIAHFKNYCALSFLKGELLADTEKILISPGVNSQSVKYLKFTDIRQIIELEQIIKSYIFEAIEVEKAGLKVIKTKSTNLDYVPELISKFRELPEFERAFDALTMGRKRGYAMYFAAAKQSETRTKRIAQYTDRIFKGKGIHDCVCGLSKRMPTCDGSHKYA